MTSLEMLQHLHPATTENQKAPAAAAAQSTADKSSGTTGAAISANAFLQLLVTELKNQDPTANQDPNAYVDQLVQVNSLQQLIQINQSLGSVTGGDGTPPAAARS